MTEVDPSVITSAQWAQIESSLIYLWIFWLTMLSAAVLFLLGHAVLPSLVFTGHATARASAARPVFYGLAVLTALAGAWAIYRFIVASEVFQDIYPKVWI